MVHRRSQTAAQAQHPSGEPLLKVAARQVGMRGAFKVLSFMVAWGICRDDLGREPTIEEYADWWKESRSTAFRHQAKFREAFPGENSPSRLLDLAAVQWDARKGVAGLGATLIPA